MDSRSLDYPGPIGKIRFDQRGELVRGGCDGFQSLPDEAAVNLGDEQIEMRVQTRKQRVGLIVARGRLLLRETDDRDGAVEAVRVGAVGRTNLGL